MMEVVEYRPGRWVKVVDGRIVGRASADEVAAWLARAEGDPTTLADPLVLDVDLDPSAPRRATDPGHSLDVPLRPAFERRRRRVDSSRSSPPGEPTGESLDGLTVEMAIAREETTRRRKRESKPEAKPEDEPVMVRCRLPTVELPPAASKETKPATQESSLPKPAGATPAASRRRPEARAPAIAGTPPPEAPAHDAPAAVPPRVASSQGPNYWWIHNVHRQPVASFLREWLPRYRDKFSHDATLVLCHEDDLAAVQAGGLEAQVSPLVQPGHFFLGHEEGRGQGTGDR
jgi:hypothetical protein